MKLFKSLQFSLFFLIGLAPSSMLSINLESVVEYGFSVGLPLAGAYGANKEVRSYIETIIDEANDCKGYSYSWASDEVRAFVQEQADIIGFKEKFKIVEQYGCLTCTKASLKGYPKANIIVVPSHLRAWLAYRQNILNVLQSAEIVDALSAKNRDVILKNLEEAERDINWFKVLIQHELVHLKMHDTEMKSWIMSLVSAEVTYQAFKALLHFNQQSNHFIMAGVGKMFLAGIYRYLYSCCAEQRANDGIQNDPRMLSAVIEVDNELQKQSIDWCGDRLSEIEGWRRRGYLEDQGFLGDEVLLERWCRAYCNGNSIAQFYIDCVVNAQHATLSSRIAAFKKKLDALNKNQQ